MPRQARELRWLESFGFPTEQFAISIMTIATTTTLSNSRNRRDESVNYLRRKILTAFERLLMKTALIP